MRLREVLETICYLASKLLGSNSKPDLSDPKASFHNHLPINQLIK